MFKVYGLENTKAQLLAAEATASDRATADLIADSYLRRGLMVRVCDWDGRSVLSERVPA